MWPLHCALTRRIISLEGVSRILPVQKNEATAHFASTLGRTEEASLGTILCEASFVIFF